VAGSHCAEIDRQEGGSIRIGEKSPGVTITGDRRNVIVDRAATEPEYIKVRLHRHPTFKENAPTHYLGNGSVSSSSFRQDFSRSRVSGLDRRPNRIEPGQVILRLSRLEKNDLRTAVPRTQISPKEPYHCWLFYVKAAEKVLLFSRQF
jgi:hypothetical protein